MGRYSKLIAATIGLSVLIAMRAYGFEIPGIDAFVIELLVSAGTAFGVYQVRNDY